LDLGQDRKGNFLFDLRRPDNKKERLPQWSREGLSRLGSLQLGPGSHHQERFILNEWTDLDTAGRYLLEARLTAPIKGVDGTSITEAPPMIVDFEVAPRDELALSLACEVLVRRIEGSVEVGEALEAAQSLSFIRDPVAVYYLGRALRSGRMVEIPVISGLERIANREAVQALIALVGQDPWTADIATGSGTTKVLARSALQNIERKTQDADMREMIRRALKRPGE